MKICISCNESKSKHWYSGPICTKCYYLKNKERILKSQDPQKKRNNAIARYYRKKDELIIKSKQYYYDNKEEILKSRKIYYEKNKKYIIKRQTAKDAERMKFDIHFMLKKRVRTRLKVAMRGNYKTGTALEFLGCSIYELKLHLESMFKPNMSWLNYGKEWEIDHINPLFIFDLRKSKDLEKACHYTNLQPLWKHEHYKKSQKDRELI